MGMWKERLSDIFWSTGSNSWWVEQKTTRYFIVNRIHILSDGKKDYQIFYCTHYPIMHGWKNGISGILLSTGSNYGWVEGKTIRYFTVQIIKFWVGGRMEYILLSTGSNYGWMEGMTIRYFTVQRIKKCILKDGISDILLSTGFNYGWVEGCNIRYFTVHRIQLCLLRRMEYHIFYCPQDLIMGRWNERLSQILLSTGSIYGWV